ncbi:MAG TPA: hypothetical protein VH682_05865 [Gemmataceae bacterium]|jgi:Leucine-rich repeat (LRR) protein
MSRSGSFQVRSLAVPLVLLAPVLSLGAEPRIKEVRTQKVGATVYFEVTILAPDDLRLPPLERDANMAAETWRRHLAGLPCLVPQDRRTMALYLLSPLPGEKTDERDLKFIGKLRDEGAAKLLLMYPNGTAAAAAKGSLLEPYLRAPTWAEAAVTLDFKNARSLDPPDRNRPREKRPTSSDLEGLWALAQARRLAVLEMQAPSFGFYHFAREATGRKYHVPVPDLGPQPILPRLDEQRRLYEMTTGGAALAESLAQRRSLHAEGSPRPRSITISDVSGVTVREHPWKEMMAGKKPAPEPLAELVPGDNYYATARSIRAYLELADQLDRWGGNILHAFELNSRDEQVRARYEKQLCLPAARLAPKLGFTTLRELAITGSDLYWREGSDVSVLFHVTDLQRFFKAVDPFIQEARDEFAAALQESKADHKGVTVESFVTPLREISLHRAVLGNFVICSNSPVALRRILDARAGRIPSLAGALDFQYMRTVFHRDGKEEDGFAFLPDAFIRQLVSPASKIKEKRRLEALSRLTLAHHAALFHAWETGRLPANRKELLAAARLEPEALRDPDGKEVVWDAARQAAVSEVYGTRNFLTPLLELTIDKVTQEEASDYAAFRADYERLWQRYFDPAGLRLSVRGRQLVVETHILPLIRSPEYDGLRMVTGNSSTTFDLTRVGNRTLVQFLISFAPQFFGPQHMLNERGAGPWALLSFDDGPGYRRLVELWLQQEFQPRREADLPREAGQYLGQLPITFGFGRDDQRDPRVAKSGKELFQLLAGSFTEAPVDPPYRGIRLTRARVAPGSSLVQWLNEASAKGSDTRTFYHAEIDGAWYASLSPAALRRLIDQSIRRRQDKIARQPITVAGSLYLAPQRLSQAADAVFGYLEWEGHRRALDNGPVWYALHKGGLLAAEAAPAKREAMALRLLGFVPVSPDGAAYRYDSKYDEVINERHGSFGRPQLRDGLDAKSIGGQLLGQLRTLRVDLRFREDGVHTALVFDRKPGDEKRAATDPVHARILQRGGWIELDGEQPDRLLARVDLAWTKTADEDLVDLKNVKHLHTLILDQTAVTDAGLKHLRDLPKLRALHLDTPGVSDAGAATLKNARRDLKVIRRSDRERFLAAISLLGRKSDAEEIDLAGANITDVWLAQLRVVPDLRKLNLKGTALTDAGLVHLKELKKLQRLDLSNTAITDTALKSLHGLPQLRWLSLEETKVTDRGADELRKALPKLTIVRIWDWQIALRSLAVSVIELRGRVELDDNNSARPRVKVRFYAGGGTDEQLSRLKGLPLVHHLNLCKTAVTDAGLKCLQGTVNLEGLDLSDTHVGDPGMAQLKGLKRLKRLDLSGTAIGDAGLKHFKELKQLEELSLYFTAVTDAGLAHLEGLTRLKEVNLRGTKVTALGIQNLRRVLPRTNLITD